MKTDEDLAFLLQAIEARNPAPYRDALDRVRTGCMKCHVAESVPYFSVQFPERRVSPIGPAERSP